MIECEIDDMNPQIFGVAMERLYAAGALEVFYVPVQMKKNRPGTLLTVVAPPALRATLSGIIFSETTTIGLRHHEVERECLAREMVTVETPLGAIRFKVARRDGRVVNAVARVRGLRAAGGRARPYRSRKSRRSPFRLRRARERTGPTLVSRFYLTTAIDYVNSRPHLGTAYEKVCADVIARYKRLCGVETHFLMGNDEHSQNVFKKAAEEGLDPLAYCDRMEEVFRETWGALDISFDDFIRTTEPRHRAGVTEMASRIHDAGDIYEGVYEGWYCVGCEAFKQEKDLVERPLPAAPDPEPQWIKEKNYFFRLSKYQRPLLEHFAAHPEFLAAGDAAQRDPAAHRGRPRRHFGQPRRAVVGHPAAVRSSSVVYVWFDALINYASAVGLGTRSRRCSRNGGRRTCTSSARTSPGSTR